MSRGREALEEKAVVRVNEPVCLFTSNNTAFMSIAVTIK